MSSGGTRNDRNDWDLNSRLSRTEQRVDDLNKRSGETAAVAGDTASKVNTLIERVDNLRDDLRDFTKGVAEREREAVRREEDEAREAARREEADKERAQAWELDRRAARRAQWALVATIVAAVIGGLIYVLASTAH